MKSMHETFFGINSKLNNFFDSLLNKFQFPSQAYILKNQKHECVPSEMQNYFMIEKVQFITSFIHKRTFKTVINNL